MFSRCVKMLLSKNLSSFSKLTRDCSKLTQVNIVLSRVKRCSCKYNSAIHRYASSFDNPEVRSSITDDFKIKRHRKVNLSIKSAFKLVEEGNYAALKSFPSALINLKGAMKSEKLSYGQAQMIISTEEFANFFEAVEDNIKEMPSENLVITLTIWRKLHLKYDNEISERMVSQLSELKNSMQFNYMTQFYFLISETHSQLKHALMVDLENCILDNLRKRIYTHSFNYATAALLISKEFFVPEEIKIQVLNYIISLSQWKSFIIYKYYLQTLISISPSNLSYKILKNLFFGRLQNEGPSDLEFITTFLAGYVLLLKEKKIEYDEKLIESLINKLINRKASLNQLRRAGISLAISRHVSYKFLVYILQSLKNDRTLKNADPHLFRVLLNLLGNSNHNHEMTNRWSGIEPLIHSTNALMTALESVEENIFEIVCIAVYLVSLGVQNDKVLRFIVKRVNTSVIERNPNLTYFLGILKQSFQTLHPTLKSDKLSFSIDKEFLFESVPGSRKELLTEMRSRLDWIRNMNDSMLLFVITQCGMLIDGLVAMNDEGELYKFSNYTRKQNSVFVEDISLPPDYKLIAFSALTNESYSRNTRSLKAIESVKLKTLEAMGYPSFYIIEEDWNKLDNEKKGQFLLKEIYKKSFEGDSLGI